MDKSGQDQDSSQKGDSSGSEQMTSYTPAQITELTGKAANDARAEAGRTAKDFEKREAALTTERAALDQRQKERDNAEDAALKDDPDAFAALRSRRASEALKAENVNLQAERDAATAENTELKQQLGGTQRERIAGVVAKDTGADVAYLLKFGGDTEEGMRELAKGAEKKADPAPAPQTDSGKSVGGGELTDAQRLKARYPSMA